MEESTKQKGGEGRTEIRPLTPVLHGRGGVNLVSSNPLSDSLSTATPQREGENPPPPQTRISELNPTPLSQLNSPSSLRR